MVTAQATCGENSPFVAGYRGGQAGHHASVCHPRSRPPHFGPSAVLPVHAAGQREGDRGEPGAHQGEDEMAVLVGFTALFGRRL